MTTPPKAPRASVNSGEMMILMTHAVLSVTISPHPTLLGFAGVNLKKLFNISKFFSD